MGLVVQKFGGTSVANVEKIKNVAQKVIREKKAGNDVVVVLSAMAGETNRLIDLATSAAETPDEREYDSLISTGEQVTITLLSIVLNSMGYPARSFLGFQVPIVTDKSYQKARISKVGTDIIGKELKDGKVVIVAGFQGIDEDNNITTLGRGGSDTSAVALAAALNATRCDIYTDVDGVYMADPAICPKARRLDKVSYEEMLEMSMTGAKVLQPRSVEMAQKYNVPVYVRSSFSDKGGTLVTKEDKKMEKEVLSGITYDRDQAKITAIHIPDKPGVAANLFTALSEHNISVDMIIQNISAQGHTDLTFTGAKKDAKQAHKIVDAAAKEIGARKVEINDDVAKISIIGVGMVSHSGVAAKMFKTLADEGINIMMISTSEIKISCVIQRRYTELAVSALHEAFQLGRKK